MADLIDRAKLIELYRSQGDERADEFPQWDYFEAFERAIAALPAQGVMVPTVAELRTAYEAALAADIDVPTAMHNNLRMDLAALTTENQTNG